MEKLPSMQGKVVAVTGCTSGTGKIFAQDRGDPVPCRVRNRGLDEDRLHSAS